MAKINKIDNTKFWHGYEINTHTAGGNINWHIIFFVKLNTHPPCNLGIPLWYLTQYKLKHIACGRQNGLLRCSDPNPWNL